MSTPKKHNCPLLNFLKEKTSGCCGPSCCSEDKKSHSHDHGHSHDHSHDHAHPHDHSEEKKDSDCCASSTCCSEEKKNHAHEHGDEHSHDHSSDPNPEHVRANIEALDSQLQARIEADLKELEEKPLEFMERQPPKYAEQEEIEANPPLFDQEALEKKEHISAGDELRVQALEEEAKAEGRAAFAPNDRADNFVDRFVHSGLQSMESNGLMAARLTDSPWSDDYWAIYSGQLGKRYADRNFPNSPDWLANYNYVQSRPASGILASGNSSAINLLSPSEKYDILVGDSSYSLTQKMWEVGQIYHNQYGTVARWMGLCHGWAAASYMLPRPSGTVTVLAADGRTQLTFYPSDIKALSTLLWAKVAPRVRFIGGRCNVHNPATDPQNGRILAQECFDTNPGTWHLAAVNQIGVARRSMILDVTFDHEVWNQPLVGYSYRYFNPQRMVYANSLAAATVSRVQFTNDRFARYRSNQAASFVGIAMEVAYVVETNPTQNPVDSSAYDKITRTTYYYDLELDFSGRIIGGEWYLNKHPDFLWGPSPGSRAISPIEAQASLSGSSWQRNQSIPSHWRQVAVNASRGYSAPLAALVEQLIRFSNNQA